MIKINKKLKALKIKNNNGKYNDKNNNNNSKNENSHNNKDDNENQKFVIT